MRIICNFHRIDCRGASCTNYSLFVMVEHILKQSRIAVYFPVIDSRGTRTITISMVTGLIAEALIALFFVFNAV